ncbi:hypothetical protein Tco_0079818, partial [Tanacetum coccineum]
MEGVVGLIRWFEKMEIVFHISNCPEKSQVKYATCTLLDSALTWWNSHKRTIRTEAAFSMSWGELMKLMTELIMMCTKMVPEEEDQMEKFIGGLPDNIKRNVIAANHRNDGIRSRLDLLISSSFVVIIAHHLLKAPSGGVTEILPEPISNKLCGRSYEKDPRAQWLRCWVCEGEVT